MTLELVRPDKKYLPSVLEAVAEYKSEPSRFDVSPVKRIIKAASENDFESYFREVENEAIGVGLKEGYVAETIYWLVDGYHYIGSFALRHSLTPNLEKIGGHIAYEIRPSARRKGYATRGLELCVEKAKEMNIDQVLVTCNAENPASYGVMHQVMLKLGGYEDEVYQTDNLIEKRVWIKTKEA